MDRRPVDISLDIAEDEVLIIAGKGGILFVSDSARSWGLDPEALVGTTGTQLVHPEDLENYLRNTASALLDQPSGELARVHRYMTGRGWRWFEGAPRVLRDQNGAVTHMVNVLKDVTDRITDAS